jgi:hypothetical protein
VDQVKEGRENVSDETFSKIDGRGLLMGFILRCDARVRVLMITFGKVVTDDGFLAGFAAVKDFVSQRGPHHGITNFSQVESFEITNELLSALSSMAPAFPAPMRRLVVASTPAAYVCTRIVQTFRSGSSAPIEIIATVDEACAMLGTNGSDLIDVQASCPL